MGIEKTIEPPLSSINLLEGAIKLIKSIIFYSLPGLHTKLTLYPSPNLFFKYKGVPTHYSLPSDITAILSDNTSASSIACVVKIMTLFLFSF